MPNGTYSAFATIKNYRAKGKKIPEELEKDLLFDALIELFEVVTPMKVWVGIFKWFILFTVPAIVLEAGKYIWDLITHKVTFP